MNCRNRSSLKSGEGFGKDRGNFYTHSNFTAMTQRAQSDQLTWLCYPNSMENYTCIHEFWFNFFMWVNLMLYSKSKL